MGFGLAGEGWGDGENCFLLLGWVLANLFAMTLVQKFVELCETGSLEACKAFYAANPGLNISACDERAFRVACYFNNLNIVKWLLEIKPNINIRGADDHAFLWACRYYNFKILRILKHNIPHYHVISKKWKHMFVARINFEHVLCDLV